MSLDAKHVRLYVIRPALEWIDFWSLEAEELVLATFAQESQLRWVDQLDKFEKPGPAYGLGQMERVTHDDIWLTFLNTRPGLRGLVRNLLTIWADERRVDEGPPPVEELHWNMLYMAAMTRLRYRRAPGALPLVSGPGIATPSEVVRMAEYWKPHYNTSRGKGTVEQFTANYERLVRGT